MSTDSMKILQPKMITQIWMNWFSIKINSKKLLTNLIWLSMTKLKNPNCKLISSIHFHRNLAKHHHKFICTIKNFLIKNKRELRIKRKYRKSRKFQRFRSLIKS